jgi:hypothetical protein
MKMTSLTLTLTLTLFNCYFNINAAFGLEQKLVRVTNDENKTVFEFVIKVDPENQDILKFYKDSFEPGQSKATREELSKDRISEPGLILEERNKHVVINLKSPNFADHNGGDIIVDTLYNGATGTRKEYELELARAGEKWELLRDGLPITSMHLKSRKIFPLGVVGIENVVTR